MIKDEDMRQEIVACFGKELRVVDATRHLGRDSRETLWCMTCGKRLRNKALGKAHYDNYHKEYPFYCEACGFGAVWFYSVVRHVRRAHHASSALATAMVIVMKKGEVA